MIITLSTLPALSLFCSALFLVSTINGVSVNYRDLKSLHGSSWMNDKVEYLYVNLH